MHKLISSLLFVCITAPSSWLQASEPSSLDKVLAAQSPEAQARFDARNPKETLEFFGIEPGMKVVEALPGAGWYSKILLPYLGKDGELVGVNYPLEVWAQFSFMTPEGLKEREKWPETWADKARGWGDENSASVSAYTFSTIPESENGTVDAILFVRALHNLGRFNDSINSLDNALEASYKVLKPGGIVGIVQHQAREDRSDEWASGSSGYLKKSFLIKQMEKAGFEFAGESDINANELDQAKEGDIVWRLLPGLRGPDETRDAREAIGESHRMTLKFRKPS